MEILDWRPRGEQFLTARWAERGAAAPREPGLLSRAWAACYAGFLARRLAGRRRTEGKTAVVSVGNLALGGTGKTPLVIALARALSADGRRGAVLTRGFGSPLAGPLRVSPDNERAGDEARLLARELEATGWDVVQARDRSAGLRHLLAAGAAPDVVLLEDGHQTAGVARDLDLLILDHWAVQETSDGPRVQPKTGAVFPLGPWRETAAGARRAKIWLLETSAAVPAMGIWGNAVLTFYREMRCCAVTAAAERAGAPARPILVSGIARPERFEKGCREVLNDAPGAVAVRLADHQPYDQNLADRLHSEMTSRGCCSLVTTAKDWVKLAPWWPTTAPVFVMDLDLHWGPGKTLPDEVGERLDKLAVRRKEG